MIKKEREAPPLSVWRGFPLAGKVATYAVLGLHHLAHEEYGSRGILADGQDARVVEREGRCVWSYQVVHLTASCRGSLGTVLIDLDTYGVYYGAELQGCARCYVWVGGFVDVGHVERIEHGGNVSLAG